MFVGWLVDFALRIGIQVGAAWLGLSVFFTAPDLALPAHLTLLLLLLGATTTGGFVAGHLSEGRQMLAGLLVGATGVLAAAVSNPGLVPVPPLLVLAQALSLATGALGGGIAGLAARRRRA
ncbi:MAG TPA: TIGR04086 family membrane protein [Chloroflexaceae bacterium]|nr:TIGR04086 family membrane protein [Chloroflexaceae bacterium]